MINIPYRTSTYIGRRNRRRFVSNVNSLRPIVPTREIPATVYSLSGESDWPEQVASIRSFLRFVGQPKQYVVVSDGSHSGESRCRIEQVHPCVSIRSLESIVRPDLSCQIKRYAAQHFLGKKLALLVSLPVDGPTVYSDSDILFFPGATALTKILERSDPVPRYLLDCWPSLDSRLLATESEGDLPVNAGFFIVSRSPDWTEALARLEGMQGDCLFFTEQTLVHLAFKANQAQPLPPDQFILRRDDQFVFSDFYAGESIALRHYVSSIRTKFWHQTKVFY
jgi:hypothetical protein